jgi:hypothetical protein
MNKYLLPTDDAFIEDVARAIAKNRLIGDAGVIVDKILGVETKIDMTETMEGMFDPIFDALWAGQTPNDEQQRIMYRADARAAVSAINLKLLTMTPE